MKKNSQFLLIILLTMVCACRIAYGHQQDSAAELNEFRSEITTPQKIEQSAQEQPVNIEVEASKTAINEQLSTKDYHDQGMKIKPFTLKQISVEDHHTYNASEFEQFYKEFIGQKIDFGTLNIITYRISKFYIDNGYLLSHAYIPLDQNFAKGEIKVKIINGGIRKVHILGAGQETDLIKEYQKKIINSYPVTKKTVIRYTKLIDLMPGYEVQLIRIVPLPDHVRTSFREYADMIIVAKKSSNKVQLKLNNNISKIYGDYKGTVTVNMFSPFKKGEEIKLVYVSSNRNKAYQNIGLIYNQPINSEGTIVGGVLSYTQSNKSANPDNKLPKQRNNTDYALDLNLSHPFILTNKFTLTGAAGLSLDQDNQYNLTGKLRQNTDVELKTSATIRYDDALRAVNYLVFGYGRGMPGSKHKAFQDSPNDAIKTNYNRFSADLYRWQPLMGDFYASAFVTSQYSSSALPSSKKLSFGSQGFVRGYRSDLISASKGVAGSLQLHYFYGINHAYVKQTEFYGFYDRGKISTTEQEKKDNFPITTSLASAGYGVKASLAGNLKVGLEIAYPLTKFKKRESKDKISEVKKGKPNTSFFLEHAVEW